MSRYAGIIKNDFTSAPGVSVTFFAQGCHQHCENCHNQDTWDFCGGKEFTEETLNEVLLALIANGLRRNLCIMGGEPLCAENLEMTLKLIIEAKDLIPNIKIFVWTGYLYEDLLKQEDKTLQRVLKEIDVLIDGPYIHDLRDITLFMRGSSNQRILNLSNKIEI